jgi:hypothetical protein
MNMKFNICGKFILFFLIILSPTMWSQTLTRTNFISVMTPQFMGSGDATRLPVVFRATVQGLTPNTTYKYYNQAAVYNTDIGTSNPGAGNPILVDADSSKYTYTTSPSLTNSVNYNTFTADASGRYTGWFAFVYTSNARFTPGNYVLPTIVLGTGTTVLQRLALDDSIKVLAFSTSAGVNNGTGIYGISSAAPKDITALFDNTSGTGKPLAMTFFQNISVTIANTVGYYTDSVSGKNGRWGTIVPNNNSNGVRRIEQFSLLGTGSVNFNIDSDGSWPSANTINPTGGSATATALRIDANSAPLPVEISYFSYNVHKNSVLLTWQTVWEINNKGFKVERNESAGEWKEIGFLNGHGTVNNPNTYEYSDKSLSSGKYNYRIRQLDFNGNSECFNLAEAVYIGSAAEFSLSQNYPNPFNPVTKISYSLSSDAFVKMEIFDVTGKLVALAMNEQQGSGYKSLEFNGSNLSTGIYFYRLTAKGSNNEMYLNKIMKMTIIK